MDKEIRHPVLSKAEQDKYQDQLGHAVTMAAKEDQIVWTIFGVFWAANAVLLTSLFDANSCHSKPFCDGKIVVSLAGIAISILWAYIQSRAIRWLEYYEAIIYKIEHEYLEIPIDVALSPEVNKSTFHEKVGHTSVSVRLLMRWSGIVTTLLWFGALLLYACR